VSIRTESEGRGVLLEAEIAIVAADPLLVWSEGELGGGTETEEVEDGDVEADGEDEDDEDDLVGDNDADVEAHGGGGGGDLLRAAERSAATVVGEDGCLEDARAEVDEEDGVGLGESESG